jgi:flagellar hook protein FlgE
MTSSILNIAVSGLNAAAARVANAATNIVNASSTNFLPQDIISLSNSVGGVTTVIEPQPATLGVTTPTPVTPAPSLTPTPTTSVNLAANLPAQAPVGFTSQPVSTQIYDSLGNTQNLSLTFTKTGVNQWNANITASNGALPSGDYTATVPLVFNSSGNAGTLAAIGSGANYTAANGQIQFPLTYPGAGTQNVTLSFGTPGSSANSITQFADTSNTVNVTNVSQNGSAYNTAPVPSGAASLPASNGNGVDIASELVNIVSASTNYGANAAVVKIAKKMDDALLNITT